MNWGTEKLQKLGFVCAARTRKGQAWVRMKVRKMESDASDGEAGASQWAVGQMVVFWPQFATQVQVAVDMTVCRLEALGALAESPAFRAQAERMRNDPEVSGGGFFAALKKFGKGFRAKVNQVAHAIAKSKILNQLRKAYVKVIQGPIADFGIEAGARALSLFGVPAAATKLAINQRRFATIDRLNHGGWAGMVERATGKDGLKGLAKEVARRQLEAGKQSLARVLPGGLDLGKLANAANENFAKAQVSGDWSWLDGR